MADSSFAGRNDEFVAEWMVQPATVAREANASQEASEPEPAAFHSRVTSVPACSADPRHLVSSAHQRNVTATCAPPMFRFSSGFPDWAFQSMYRYMAETSPQLNA
jgi:hypothetical protein